MGVLGGMFDPPHVGHLILAGEAAWQLRLDEVRLVVCARPPHRAEGWLAAETRLRLVERATDMYPGLVASRAEIDRPGPSYTVDTLGAFAAAEADTAFWLILGADQLATFARWRDPDRIVALARLAVASRSGPGTDPGAVGEQIAPGRVDRIDMPDVAISSTMIRERIASGAPVRHLVSPSVDDQLATEGLLRGPSALP